MSCWRRSASCAGCRSANRWWSRSSSTAWRSPSPRAPTARAWKASSASSRRASDSRMAAARQRADKHEIKATQRASGEARSLAQTMPRLILEARRIAATVIHGLHGRKRAGPGENFWQYRRFVWGEPARRVDWRRSARDDHLYVREQEPKLDRTLVVAFALAEVLVHAGERVGVPGLMRPTGSRNVLDKFANAIVHDPTERP